MTSQVDAKLFGVDLHLIRKAEFQHVRSLANNLFLISLLLATYQMLAGENEIYERTQPIVSFRYFQLNQII